MRTKNIVALLSTAALLGLVSTQAFAAPVNFGLAKGRTTAIRAGIASALNKRIIAHVNYEIGRGKTGRVINPGEIRFNSKVVPSGVVNIMGEVHRAVNWKLSSGILRGTAKAITPILPGGGGKLTSVQDVKTTVMPRGLPPQAQQNSGLGGRMVNLTVQAPIRGVDSFGVPLVNQQAYSRAMAQLPSVHAANIARSPGTAVQQTTTWLRGQGFTIR